jgi:hypothetical protein
MHVAVILLQCVFQGVKTLLNPNAQFVGFINFFGRNIGVGPNDDSAKRMIRINCFLSYVNQVFTCFFGFSCFFLGFNGFRILFFKPGNEALLEEIQREVDEYYNYVKCRCESGC